MKANLTNGFVGKEEEYSCFAWILISWSELFVVVVFVVVVVVVVAVVVVFVEVDTVVVVGKVS